MKFAEVGDGGLAPVGEFVARIVDAVEKPAFWDADRVCLALTLEVEDRGRVFTVTDWTGLENGRRLAVICRACGVEPVGEVDPSMLVDRLVGVELVRKTSKAGREFAAVKSFRLPESRGIETRPAVLQAPPTMRPQVPKSEQSGDGEFPF